MRFTVRIFVLLLMAGCTTKTHGVVEAPANVMGPPPPAQHEALARLPISVRLRGMSFLVKDGEIDFSSRKRLVSNGVVYTGNAFELELELDRPAHAYVLQFLADGTATVLHPADNAQGPLPAGVHRLPTERDVAFVLDGAPGPEVLYIIVSDGALPLAQQQLVDEVRALPEGALYPVTYEIEEEEKTPPPPQPSSAPTPPAKLTANGAASVIRRSKCRPMPKSKTGLTARNDCIAGEPRAGLTARSIKRVRLGKDLASGATEADGVAIFIVLFDHRLSP